jgi:hypothetical protein
MRSSSVARALNKEYLVNKMNKKYFKNIIFHDNYYTCFY